MYSCAQNCVDNYDTRHSAYNMAALFQTEWLRAWQWHLQTMLKPAEASEKRPTDWYWIIRCLWRSIQKLANTAYGYDKRTFSRTGQKVGWSRFNISPTLPCTCFTQLRCPISTPRNDMAVWPALTSLGHACTKWKCRIVRRRQKADQRAGSRRQDRVYAKKLELISLTRRHRQHNPPCIVDEDITVRSVPPTGAVTKQHCIS